MGERLLSIVGQLPTTNLSWCFAWLLVVGTIAFYLLAGLASSALASVNQTCEKVLGVEPNGEILMFVGGIFAACVAQHATKRFTYRASPPAQPDVEDAPVQNGGNEVIRSEEEQEP